jgi:ATP-dependent HslUV protease subunit HslV
MPKIRSTTILCVRHRGTVAIAADGQVTVGNTVLKHNSKKIRRMHKDRVLAGFAGSTADALTLFEKFEQKLEQHRGNLTRAAVELAKDWRTDRVLRKLEALMIVADAEVSFLISGSGDVIEPEDGVLAIGSGGPFALAAARGILSSSDLDAAEVARRAMAIAADIDIYTNSQITLEELK